MGFQAAMPLFNVLKSFSFSSHSCSRFLYGHVNKNMNAFCFAINETASHSSPKIEVVATYDLGLFTAKHDFNCIT